MRELKGKTAIVTGAASGIGLGMARAFARAGMNVALADIEAGALEAALAEVKALGARAIAVVADVSDPASLRAAAAATQAEFGALHIACNNAGVSVHGTTLEATRREDIDWIVAVNVGGVINGIQAFLPAIRRHGQGGHVVNTASIGGLQVNKDFLTGYYSMTKYAVVALSEALENELAGTNIGVSVLCPAAVNTKIWGTARARPARLGGPFERPENHFMRETLERVGMAPDLIGERVVGAIRDGEFYILTHANLRDRIEARHARIAAALDRAAAWEREIAGRTKA